MLFVRMCGFQVYREVDVMKLVSHPNIVKLYQVKPQYTDTYI